MQNKVHYVSILSGMHIGVVFPKIGRAKKNPRENAIKIYVQFVTHQHIC